MCLPGKGKIPNLASFINKYFNIVQTSIIALILLFLEKIMDMEFVCPDDYHWLGIGYSSVFLIIPAAVVLLVSCYFSSSEMCCKKKEDNTENGEDGQESVPLRGEGDVEPEQSSQSCGDTCMAWLNDYKAIILWVIIVLTDGRYFDCLFKSAYAIANNCTMPLPECPNLTRFPVVQACQITGLSLILLAMVFILCLYNSKSKRLKKIYEDVLLQVTKDTIVEQAKKKQKEHIVAILNGQNWPSFKVGGSDTLEKLEELKTKCEKEVKRQLHHSTPTRGTGETEGQPIINTANV